jgi:hypothetical protein
MSIKTVTTGYRVCDRCHVSEDRNGKFEEYPNGAGFLLDRCIDLCDRCVESGFVVFKGRIMNESEIDDDFLDRILEAEIQSSIIRE